MRLRVELRAQPGATRMRNLLWGKRNCLCNFATGPTPRGVCNPGGGCGGCCGLQPVR